VEVPRWNCAAARSWRDADWGACCLLVGRRGYARCDNEIPPWERTKDKVIYALSNNQSENYYSIS
jgi:hypothetical protein